MNVISPFRADLRLIVKATWPDVTNPTFRMTQIQRRNWVNEISSGKLTAPYCVIEMPPPTNAAGWSPSAVTYLATPTVYYIAAEKDGGGDIGALIEQRLSALTDALLFGGFPYTVTEEPTADTSASQAVNDSMLAAEMPYLSGALTFGALIGYVRVYTG